VSEGWGIAVLEHHEVPRSCARAACSWTAPTGR
jgi:hypothetical protein